MGNVTFPDRFELIELLREDEVQTFRARDRATGRFFEAHFAASPDLLSEVPSVIDRGSHEGKFYVVSAPPAEAPLDSAGAWRIRPAAQPASPAPQEPAAEPTPGASPGAGPASTPGDFTRMFQLRQAPEPLAAPASRNEERAPAAASRPGEFTRAFPRVFERPAMAPSAAPVDSPAPGQPGDFTRMFQQPAVPPVPVVPDPSVPAPSVAASQPEEAGPAAPARLPSGLIVIAVVVLSAIAVFVLVRTLY